MIAPAKPDNERERSETLHSYGILDSEQKNDFDEVVPDATLGARFKGNLFVTGHSHIRYYAGMPPTTPGTNGERGSGLGMPMCQEFVQAHGGRIRVETATGAGAVFRVTFSA